MIFDFETEAATGGTSLKGYVLATRAELTGIFGEPGMGSADGKTNFEWSLLFTNPRDRTDTVRATIYDWKREIKIDELDEFALIEWHIGGDKLDAVHCVAGHLLASREEVGVA